MLLLSSRQFIIGPISTVFTIEHYFIRLWLSLSSSFCLLFTVAQALIAIVVMLFLVALTNVIQLQGLMLLQTLLALANPLLYSNRLINLPKA